jgi:hypothetical protein
MSGLSWNEIKKFHLTPPKHIIPRKKSVQALYRIREKDISNEEKLLCTRLFPNNEPYNICLNEFPYHLEDGIEHLVLWLNPTIYNEDSDVDDIFKSEIKNRESVYFKNIKEIRSIKGIPHYHIFVKNTPINSAHASL